MMHLNPLFIIGTQRSGSNLLRLMLNESPHLAAPHPPHILKTFFPLLPIYGDLSIQENFVSLVEDICEFVAENPVEWEVSPTPAQIIAACKQPSLIEIMCRIYELPARAKGATYWCCKSMANVEYLPLLHAALPHAKFLYLYRDGRDVALSFTKAYVGEKHFYPIAQQWKNDQRLCLDFAKNYPNASFLKLQYEAFIHNPIGALHEICTFLNIPFTQNMMQYYTSPESHRTAASGEMWANVVKPVLSDNHQKFLRECSPEQIRIFEAVAHQELSELGYPLTNPENRLVTFSAEEITLFQQENQALKQAIRTKISPTELSKRAGQDSLLRRIQARSGS